MLFATVVGIPLGIISAYRHNSAVDVGTMIGANIGVSMPVFWLGLMLAYIFARDPQRIRRSRCRRPVACRRATR